MTKRIILCGKSVFLTAVEAALAARPDLKVQRLHPCLPDIAERIVSRQADVVMVEDTEEHLILVLLRRDVLLIELNTMNNGFRLLGGLPITISDVDDLVRAIDRISSAYKTHIRSIGGTDDGNTTIEVIE